MKEKSPNVLNTNIQL